MLSNFDFCSIYICLLKCGCTKLAEKVLEEITSDQLRNDLKNVECKEE